MRRGLAPRRERGQRYDVYDIRAMAVRGDTSERLAQDIEDMALELGRCIQQQEAMVRQGHLPRQGPRASDQPHIGDRMAGARKGSVVSKEVRAPVKLEMLWMRAVLWASGRVTSGKMVVS
jgi:hypothetical protein